MSHAPTVVLGRRHDRIRDALRQQSLDALVITGLSNVTYLTNFTGSAAVVILTGERLLFITDFRYQTTIADLQQSAYACPDLQLVPVGGSYDATVAKTISELRSGRVAFEAAHLPVSRHQWWQAFLSKAASPPSLVATEDIVEAARAVKDAHEIEVMREAGRRLSDAAASIVDVLRAGRTEREVAAMIDLRLRAVGFDRPAFDTIVAAGPNAALPHARPSDRRLAEGDLVVLDFGGVYDSYCVDLTRTIFLGRASSRAQRVHAAVLSAHDAAIAAVGPGQSRFAVDAAARNRLAGLGFADAFGHGTGHGLGLDVHEAPRIVQDRPDVDRRHEFLAPGMIFTIEPGAYFPGWGGVRIEDDVLVTNTGAELLTHAPTSLLER